MKVSPIFLASMYMLMGLAFVYLGLQSADETIWNAGTIIFTVVATFDFIVAFRILGAYFRHKNNTNNKE
ncbi:DUF4305 domain-containing protein [Filobacillus milosensis]|uniref:DUF4305 domain-containing protein n=1 Tax=Filobacillus milosensis TaxID=94137 RepID=A0A4Y8IF85_9BACI|nr:YdiK family protein [Filobacillus milosensis]TFB13690.1 DUF4305 domain-containing protein [Filobacillus milosensis]